MDCFSDDPQPYEIVVFTPEKCKDYVDTVIKRKIGFTNPYEVANYFFVLYTGSYRGFEETDLIFIKMKGKMYYFKNVDEMLIRFTSEDCTKEWYPMAREWITNNLESYIVLDYISKGMHLVFQPWKTEGSANQLYENYIYFCVTQSNLWSLIQRSKKTHTICTIKSFNEAFASKNILSSLSKKCLTTLDGNPKGFVSTDKNSPIVPSTRIIQGIPKYLITKEGKVYGEGMKVIKQYGDKMNPKVVLTVKGEPVPFNVKDLVEKAWLTKEERFPDPLRALGTKITKDSKDLEEPSLEIVEGNTSHSDELINAFITLFTADTWVEEVSKIIESNYETKRRFLSFLKSLSLLIPKNETLESALDTTKYEPLVSLLNSKVSLDPDPVIYNVFDSI